MYVVFIFWKKEKKIIKLKKKIVGLIFSFDIPLDFHSTIVSVIPVRAVKVLQVGWNIKRFCNLSC